jgi:hypothetical protein
MTVQTCEPTIGRLIRPLLATHKRASADTAWADVATSVDEALALWRERRHMHRLRLAALRVHRAAAGPPHTL